MKKRPENRVPKVQRNDPCPCGSGRKYKRCCAGRVDWTRVLRSGDDTSPLLSVRGRNLQFVEGMWGALQLDKPEAAPRSLEDYRAAFTPEAVKAIHESILDIWPLDTDIDSVLRGLGGDVSGLYVGDYRIMYLRHALVRHSTYANKILVVDPFMYPPAVADEYNPILSPEKYRSQTLRNVNFYTALLPWILADIVNVIRTPADFDSVLQWESMRRQEAKFKENESLREAMKRSQSAMEERFKGDAIRELILDAPDDHVQRLADDFASKHDGATPEQVMAYVKAMRARDLDFLEPAKWGESRITTFSTGANYEIAKMTADLTGSYLVTDLSVRWKEIELDRESHNAQNKAWAPFAKAVQEAQFRYLDQVSLGDALALRQAGRLEGLRSFFHRVWRDAIRGDEYDEANAAALADELHEKVREAEDEWRKIDLELLKMMAQGAAAALLSAGPLVASGHASFLAAAAVVPGGVGLTASTMRRRGFSDRFPAAFFTDLSEGR
jgi:hypothetical protein